MFAVSKLLEDAYYIAGIKSRTANETISTQEQQTAFDIYNEIIDQYSQIVWFSAFLDIKTMQVSTRNIYIGRNITGGDDITVVDEAPFKAFFSASLTSSLTNGFNFSLTIKSLSDTVIGYIESSVGLPEYFYWANQLQDNNIYTNIELYPAPSQPSTLKMAGFRMIEQSDNVSDEIIPTFYNYIKYLVARELASQSGLIQDFMAKGKMAYLKELEGMVKSAAPIDSSPNNNSFLLRRNYYSG